MLLEFGITEKSTAREADEQMPIHKVTKSEKSHLTFFSMVCSNSADCEADGKGVAVIVLVCMGEQHPNSVEVKPGFPGLLFSPHIYWVIFGSTALN